jgi:hypothetical protein
LAGDAAAAPSLLDAALFKIKDKGPQCSIKTLLVQYPDKAGEIAELLANTGKDKNNQPRGRGLPFSVAAETLSDGFRRGQTPLDGATISRHINGRCSCG